MQLQNNIYWVKGANGSGKTTLLKMIAALLPFEGDILLNGISINRQPLAYRRQVSWAEAEPLYPEFMTGSQLISLHQNIRKASTDHAKKLIQLFSMTGFVNHTIGTYSAGMKKKLSLVLAFLGNQKLVILDEPLVTLDKETVSVVCNYILNNHSKNGTCFLMSSHQEPDTKLLISGRQITVANQTVSITA